MIEPDEEDSSSPEARLWGCVIALAWTDVFGSPDTAGDSRKRSTANAHDREESLRLLTDTEGEFAEHRAFMCSLAGVCESELRDRALRALAEPTKVTARPPLTEKQIAHRHQQRERDRQRSAARRAAKAAEMGAQAAPVALPAAAE